MDFSKELLDKAQLESLGILYRLASEGLDSGKISLVAMFFSANAVCNVALAHQNGFEFVKKLWLNGFSMVLDAMAEESIKMNQDKSK